MDVKVDPQFFSSLGLDDLTLDISEPWLCNTMDSCYVLLWQPFVGI